MFTPIFLVIIEPHEGYGDNIIVPFAHESTANAYVVETARERDMTIEFIDGHPVALRGEEPDNLLHRFRQISIRNTFLH